MGKQKNSFAIEPQSLKCKRDISLQCICKPQRLISTLSAVPLPQSGIYLSTQDASLHQAGGELLCIDVQSTDSNDKTISNPHFD